MDQNVPTTTSSYKFYYGHMGWDKTIYFRIDGILRQWSIPVLVCGLLNCVKLIYKYNSSKLIILW